MSRMSNVQYGLTDAELETGHGSPGLAFRKLSRVTRVTGQVVKNKIYFMQYYLTLPILLHINFQMSLTTLALGL